MTKEEFKQRWESDANGGGITMNDIAKAAKDWGIFRNPKIRDMYNILYKVLKAANTQDCEEYNRHESSKTHSLGD